MTFNKDLFLKLCQEYDVPFSRDYTSIMLEDNGYVRELNDEDIERVMPPSDTVSFSYENVWKTDIQVNIPQKSLNSMTLLSDEALTAA